LEEGFAASQLAGLSVHRIPQHPVFPPGPAGLRGPPRLTVLPVIPMSHVLIIHEVADYPAWKKVFDAAATIRKQAGERTYQVLRYQHDANRIVHFSAWTSLENARRFFESPELVRIREEAGVKAPEFIYLEQIEAGVL
jgi:quinol monooxygenase YgiN